MKHYSTPNHLNKEPFLHVWWMEDEDKSLCYLQISEDKHNPHWVKWGDILDRLTRHTDNFEETILKDVIAALKSHESLPSVFFKKYS